MAVEMALCGDTTVPLFDGEMVVEETLVDEVTGDDGS